MTTIIVGWVLVSLVNGTPIASFKGEDNGQCIEASYRYALVTGQEARCLPQRMVVK